MICIFQGTLLYILFTCRPPLNHHFSDTRKWKSSKIPDTIFSTFHHSTESLGFEIDSKFWFKNSKSFAQNKLASTALKEAQSEPFPMYGHLQRVLSTKRTPRGAFRIITGGGGLQLYLHTFWGTVGVLY